jgi:hypothetical protein
MQFKPAANSAPVGHPLALVCRPYLPPLPPPRTLGASAVPFVVPAAAGVRFCGGAFLAGRCSRALTALSQLSCCHPCLTSDHVLSTMTARRSGKSLVRRDAPGMPDHGLVSLCGAVKGGNSQGAHPRTRLYLYARL